MSSPLLVERALALIPDWEEFLPLSDAVIGSSEADREKLWARSGAYATIGKRVVDAERVKDLLPVIAERAQRRLQDLFTLVLQAIQEQQNGEMANAALTLIRAGELEEGERLFEKAQRLYAMALEIARGLREREPHILALRRLGRVARALGRLDEARRRYEESYQLSTDQRDRSGRVIACQGLGNVADARGRREEARRWYERGLTIAEGLDAPGIVWPFYTNLSILALQEGELARAEVMLDRARELIDAAGDEQALIFWYNNRGLLFFETGDAVAAEGVYRESLERFSDPFWQMTIRVNLGHALVRQGRLFEAAEEARRAEELAILYRFVADLVDVYDLLGVIARERRDEEGFVFYEQALEVCQERELPQVQEAAIYRGYGLLHRSCGHPAEARAYLERSRDIYASLGLATEESRVTGEIEAISE